MKRIRLLTFFSIVFMLLLSLCTLTACGHNHDFSAEVATDKYLASEASCTNKATYYYSCECGEKGESIFEFGGYVHNYSQKVESSQYIASEGNCLKKATYYFSCSCGNKGEDTFDCDEFDHELGADDNCNICQNPPTKGLEYRLNEDGKSYYVAGIGNAGDVDNIVIAPYYNNLPVTNVGAYAFEQGWHKSVIIHDGITGIDRSAFVECASLESIILPDSLKSIGECAFYMCTNLSSVSLPDSLTSIGNYAFYACSRLESITLPDSLTSIGEYAFKSCGGFIDITVPNTVQEIGFGAFYGCGDLTSITLPFLGKSKEDVQSSYLGYIFGAEEYDDHYFYIPMSLKEVTVTIATQIGECAFYFCENLETVNIGDGVSNIDAKAFYSCYGLMRINVSENNATYKSIDGCLYSKDGKVFVKYPKVKEGKSFVIPNEIDSINDYAFEGCHILDEIIIPDGVKSIGKYAFEGCDSLVDIVIPDSVEYIGIGALKNCDDLTCITVPFIGQSRDMTDNMTYLYDAYDASYIPWSLKKVIVTSATQIKAVAFEYCEYIESISLSDTVTSIGRRAFAGCTSLTSIDIDSNNAVYRCEGGCIIEKATNTLITACNINIIPDGVEIIGKGAFDDSVITSITIPDSVKIIEENAFSSCNLKSITIPNSVKSIGKNAFNYCSSLKNVIIDGDGLSIGERAFDNCTALTSVIIKDGVSSIGTKAFYYCSALTSIRIGSGVKSIGDSAFLNCRALTTVFYKGAAAEWDEISIEPYNNSLANATIYYYSETEPELSEDGSAYEGNYWHYDTDGITPTIWTKQD